MNCCDTAPDDVEIKFFGLKSGKYYNPSQYGKEIKQLHLTLLETGIFGGSPENTRKKKS